MYNQVGLHATFLRSAFHSFFLLLAFGQRYLYFSVKSILIRMRYANLMYLHLLSTFYLQILTEFKVEL